MEELTFRERILRTFEKREVGRIVWQPRIYSWYNARSKTGDIPHRYKGKSMLEIYDDLNASPRYPHEVLGISVFEMSTDNKVECHMFEEGENIVRIYETPKGSLREVKGPGEYHIEHPVKTPEDIEIMTFVLDHTDFSFDRGAFEEAERRFGSRGITQTYYPYSPFQRLIVEYMGLENTIYALNDYPGEIGEFMKAIEEWDDRMYEVILDSPLKILNFGENIDVNLDSPILFEKYLAPYYEKRVNQIHARGKFCHIHMNGSLKPLLPIINEAGFDGIEGATPLPQGDFTLEELKEAIGDTILLDGIPAILFLPQYSNEDLEKFATKVLEIFSPNLILGVSDEFPPPSDIERIRLVSKLVENYRV